MVRVVLTAQPDSTVTLNVPPLVIDRDVARLNLHKGIAPGRYQLEVQLQRGRRATVMYASLWGDAFPALLSAIVIGAGSIVWLVAIYFLVVEGLRRWVWTEG